MSIRAKRAIEEAEVIIGYRTYIDLIRHMIGEHQELIDSGMTREVERSLLAIEKARTGKNVIVVSSGDPGIYGMAGIVLELALKEADRNYDLEIVPGISSANAAAASLGAPLMHDFATISLSDLLTPWELIVKRLEHAAAGDFITSLYNPASKKRRDQIVQAQQIFLQHRPADTPVGIVRNAKRADEDVVITTLGEMLTYPIDMFTVIIMGNSQSYATQGWLVTPRGYRI